MSRNVPAAPLPIRQASRLLVIDDLDRLLLFRIVGESPDGSDFWLPPGGGLLPGETHTAAAVRELREETGITASLGPCVWIRRYVSQLHDQREQFFVVRVPPTALRTDGFEPHEWTSFGGARWWSLPDILASDVIFVPCSLGELLPAILAGDYPSEPIDCGV
jgi:8-oxo-dGTP pyrophosphatase MutT (NUDIX family)